MTFRPLALPKSSEEGWLPWLIYQSLLSQGLRSAVSQVGRDRSGQECLPQRQVGRSSPGQYGPSPLFTNVSLDLRAGERVGLIGPNGSGKSTLLKILACVETPDSGSVALRRTARLGYLPQEETFDPDRTVCVADDRRGI